MSLRLRLALAAALVAGASAAATAMLIVIAAGWMPPGGWPRLALAAAVAVVAVGLPAALLAFRLGDSIERPLHEAVAAAEAIAAGDLSREVILGGRDEPGRLLAAFVAMQHSVGGLVGRIKSAGERLVSVEAEAASALDTQERAVNGFSGSAHDIAAAVAEISATSEQLLDATGGLMEVARDAAGVADEGRGGLESMTASMHQLDEAMNAFTRKLATISQRASGITSVVTTIAKVAEQTNLLSVNATIEAEKAGESGRGFRIVAQEIRRLADQTALATKDIERMVRDMQAAVAGGTMEMDRFRNEVSGRIGEVADVSEKLGRIIEPVQSVTRSLEQVHEGMEAQSQGARQIRNAMESLRGDAAESASSLTVLTKALRQLHAAIGDLNTEASRFQA